jgi:hypothetical protein
MVRTFVNAPKYFQVNNNNKTQGKPQQWNEYRILKLVEITIRRGLKEKGEE